MLKNMEIDNVLAISLVGIIAITSMVTNTQDSQIVTSVIAGLIGYMSKGISTRIK